MLATKANPVLVKVAENWFHNAALASLNLPQHCRDVEFSHLPSLTGCRKHHLHTSRLWTTLSFSLTCMHTHILIHMLEHTHACAHTLFLSWFRAFLFPRGLLLAKRTNLSISFFLLRKRYNLAQPHTSSFPLPTHVHTPTPSHPLWHTLSFSAPRNLPNQHAFTHSQIDPWIVLLLHAPSLSLPHIFAKLLSLSVSVLTVPPTLSSYLTAYLPFFHFCPSNFPSVCLCENEGIIQGLLLTLTHSRTHALTHTRTHAPTEKKDRSGTNKKKRFFSIFGIEFKFRNSSAFGGNSNLRSRKKSVLTSSAPKRKLLTKTGAHTKTNSISSKREFELDCKSKECIRLKMV